MGRSRKLTLTDWTAANNALMQYFEGNKSKLAKHIKMSRTTITDFFNEKPIGENSLRKICLALRLNWQESSSGYDSISPSDINTESFQSPTSPKKSSTISSPLTQLNETLVDEDLVQKIREYCRQKILSQHSRMRLLSGEETSVDQLYVDVWLLEKPERMYLNSPGSLLSNFDIENDRLALSKRTQSNSNPGFEIANSHPKLVILGKPGSGKTTFLKHLAVDWCRGKFQPEKIAVLLELRRIQDTRWDIWSAVGQNLGLEDWFQFAERKERISNLKEKISSLRKKHSRLKTTEKNISLSKYKKDKGIIKDIDIGIGIGIEEEKKIEEEIRALNGEAHELEKGLDSFQLHSLLKQGKLLILMDGLDEVRNEILRHNVQLSLKQIFDDYSDENWIIITCRTQTMESNLGGFTSVEVAKFSPEQVMKFVQNWFTANGQNQSEVDKTWKRFHSSVMHLPDLIELTKTPVLLSLVCLVFQDEGRIPTDRNWLYRKGIELLLSRWNDSKEIEEWKIGADTYCQLSIEEKEALLIEIAARKFENPKNFVLYEQDELVKQISKKLDLDNIQEGIAVLRAIESQHGLLIERADELWSFSHLTFQEHFTVQWLTQLRPKQLEEKIADKNWQSVVTQLVKSQQPADRLLRLIKQAIDQSASDEPDVQSWLTWLVQKSESAQSHCKGSATRAFYYSLGLEINQILTFEHPFDHDLIQSLDRVHTLEFSLPRALGNIYNLVRTLDLNFAPTRDHDLDLELTLVIELAHALESAFDLEHTADVVLRRTLDLTHEFTLALDRAIDKSDSHNLKLMKEMQIKLPVLNDPHDTEKFRQWWWKDGQDWITDLREIMIEHRNIGHDWEFTEGGKQQLQRHYNANKFLVDLMKIDGAVGQEFRAEIEEGLLLPWAELQHRQPHLYGELDEFQSSDFGMSAT